MALAFFTSIAAVTAMDTTRDVNDPRTIYNLSSNFRQITPTLSRLRDGNSCQVLDTGHRTGGWDWLLAR